MKLKHPFIIIELFGMKLGKLVRMSVVAKTQESSR